MNITFTIITKSYLHLAKTLMDSIKKSNINYNCKIFIVDEDFDSYNIDGYEVVSIYKVLSKEKIEEFSFKYNVTEFCTSVKPFIFQFIFSDKSVMKTFYFDPDILVLNSLEELDIELDNFSVLLTPHIVSSSTDYKGLFRETTILSTGVYNLGFCAFKNDEISDKILNWWAHQLDKYCYADKFEGIAYDQNWASFFICFFPENVKVVNNVSYNIALWNIHERSICKIDEKWFVKNLDNELETISFVHFSNFNYGNIDSNLFFEFIGSKSLPKEFMQLAREYQEKLISNLKYRKCTNYLFEKFDNNITIHEIHRQLYRRMIMEGKNFRDLFSSKGEYYKLLLRNDLIDKNYKKQKINELNFKGFDWKYKVLKLFLKVIFKILGVSKYEMYLKFNSRNSRLLNQSHLLGENYDFGFYNENRFNN